MKKRLLISLILMAGFVFAYSTQASACGCSPGFFKNHFEVWEGMGCSGVYDDDTLLDMLSPQGTLGSKADRETAAEILNSCMPEACADD